MDHESMPMCVFKKTAVLCLKRKPSYFHFSVVSISPLSSPFLSSKYFENHQEMFL